VKEDITQLNLFAAPRWTDAHKRWHYGCAMMYKDGMAKIVFQPVVRYVVGRQRPEPLKYAVAIKMKAIPRGDGKLGSLYIHSVAKE